MSYVTTNAESIPLFNIKHNFDKNYFFPSSIIEWNNLDAKLRNSENFDNFKNNILKFIRPKPNSFFTCCNLKGIRLIKRLWLELSHLREHKFKYNFQNLLNPLFSCGSSIESTSHFLSYWSIFNDKRHTLLSTLNNIYSKILESNDPYLAQTLLFYLVLLHLIQRQTRLFLTQPLTIFYPLKDLKNVFFKKPCFSYAIYLILSDQLFFCIPRHLKFSVPGDCDFLVYCQGVHVCWKTWKSWKCPGIFFCPGICLGIYHFQSFVLEMSWNFFATVHHFFSYYFCQSSQHPEKSGKFFTILDPIW